MKKYLSSLLILVCACTDHDNRAFDKAYALQRASTLCQASSANLAWLSDVLDKAQRGGQLEGSVYAFRYSNGVAIVHQALIMSCVACVAYDCGGQHITMTPDIHKEIASGMTDKNLILKPY